MDRQKVAAVVVTLVVIGVGLGIFFANQGAQNAESTPIPKVTSRPAATATAAPASEAKTQPIIRATDSGFSPATLTVKSGDTVTVTNDSNQTVDFASDSHPTHTLNPFLNIGNIEPGQSKTATIPRAGTFGYHNHLNPAMKGTIVAQ